MADNAACSEATFATSAGICSRGTSEARSRRLKKLKKGRPFSMASDTHRGCAAGHVRGRLGVQFRGSHADLEPVRFQVRFRGVQPSVGGLQRCPSMVRFHDVCVGTTGVLTGS